MSKTTIVYDPNNCQELINNFKDEIKKENVK